MGVEQLLLGIPETATDLEAQDGLRRALSDPSLQLVLWDPEDGSYVDLDGRPFTLPGPADLPVASVIASEQHGMLGALVHDRTVLEDCEALDSVLAVARLALQRERLGAELGARLADLERERDFIRHVVSVAPAFFIVIDLEGMIVRFNDTLVTATGIADDERVRGRLFAAVFAASDAREQVAGLIAEQAPGRHEHRWRGRDGEEFVVEWSLTPITDEHGDPRLLITGLDVSERARHEQELERERDFLSTVGKVTPSLLCVVHADGVVDSRGVNATFRLMTGVDDEQAVGCFFWDLVIPSDHVDGFRAAFLSAVAGGDEVRHETPWLAAAGGELTVEWSLVSLAGYRPGHYMICGTDVINRKREEEAVRSSRARLVDAADSERQRLERNLHDGAQQRLVSVSLTLRVAESKLDDPPQARSLLAEAGDELALALGELRELARGLHPAILADRGLGPALGILAERSVVPVELALDVHERLPDPVEVAVFYIVSESLTNVARYASATSARVHVERQDDALVVAVADDGVGGADPTHGTGLRGLADRVATLDGSLEIESAPGQGTTVRAALPLRAARRTGR